LADSVWFADLDGSVFKTAGQEFPMEHCVFIHTNHKQIVGALVAEHSLRRNSAHNDKFDVRIIHHKDYPFFTAREGQLFLRDVRAEMRHNHVRHDALEILDRTPPLTDTPRQAA
jgi:hypothetical protein